MQQKRRFGTRFRETATTNALLTEIVAKPILHQKRRFGIRFRETVPTFQFHQKIMYERILHKNVVLALDFEKHYRVSKSYALANPTKKMGKSSREMGMSYQDTNPNFFIQNPFCIIFC